MKTRPTAWLATIALQLLAISLVLSCRLSAEEFQQVAVNYQLKGQNKSNTVDIPIYEGDSQPPIRGVIQNVRGPLKTFAYENNVALIARLDEGRGFSKALLKAAAEAAERPEIEFAGAIVEGISKGGREAADWAAANQERAIAVILDHSAIWSMDFPKRVSGVPMFFNATYADMFQNIDRRKSHFEWCSAAYKAGQPCTSIIDHVQKGGHGGRGSTDLTAIWLGEVMNLRVPANVPTGKAYKLIDVKPSKVGGYVSAKISMDGKRSYHDKVKVTTKPSGASWWVPGPKSAALYLEWVEKNGGSIEKDESAQIKNAPVFLDLPRELARAADLVADQKWGQAYAELQKSPNKNDHFAKTLASKVNSNVEAHIALIKKLDAAGDVCGIYTNFQNYAKTYRGIPAYDELLAHYGICDNYATHKHAKVKAWQKRNPRFHFHYTPTSASWLNMVERFFRDLTVNRLRRGVFHNVPDLTNAIDQYVAHHNDDPKPFVWTATASDILEKVKRGRAKLNKQ